MDNDFAVFIMVWGRPDKMWTAKTLRKYKDRYDDDLLVFSKTEMKDLCDPGDNTGDLRSTMYAVNAIPGLAKERGIKYYFIFCDDYTRFDYRFDESLNYTSKKIKDLDGVFSLMLSYYKSISALSLAISQTGDFIGGERAGIAKSIKIKRKAMNAFLCSTDRPFQFLGRMNEDVTTYVNLGSKGGLFISIPNVVLYQRPTQSDAGGLTSLYLDYGTYIKSFFSVMYNPSCVKVGQMGESHKRIHHRVSWNNAVPCIIGEKYKKSRYTTVKQHA